MLRWREAVSAYPRKDAEKGAYLAMAILPHLSGLAHIVSLYSCRSGSTRATLSSSPFVTSKTTKPTLLSSTPLMRLEVSKRMVNFPRTRRSTRPRPLAKRMESALSISARTTERWRSTICKLHLQTRRSIYASRRI